MLLRMYCLQGAYITALTEPHAGVQTEALLALHSQTRQMYYVFWVFFLVMFMFCFVIYINNHMQVL